MNERENKNLPMDWGNDYYPQGTTQDEIIRRLFMCGEGDSVRTGTRIPRGDIYGVGFTLKTSYWSFWNKYRDWNLGVWNTGLEGMNRAPAHK